jgi:hypothetical protein
MKRTITEEYDGNGKLIKRIITEDSADPLIFPQPLPIQPSPCGDTYRDLAAMGEEAPTVAPLLCVGVENDDGEIPICWYIDETGEYGAPWGVVGPLLEAANG